MGQPPFNQIEARRAARIAAGLQAPSVPLIGTTEVRDRFGRALQPGDIITITDFDPARFKGMTFQVVGTAPHQGDGVPPGVMALQLREEITLQILVHGGQPTGNLLLAFRPEPQAQPHGNTSPDTPPEREPALDAATLADAQSAQAAPPAEEPPQS